MFTMSNKTDYGLILLGQLRKEEKFVPLAELVEKTHLPQRFIARIASDLVKAGILMSREGKVGGYKVAKKLTDINLLDYLKIFEGNVETVKCNAGKYNCRFEEFCQHKHSLSIVISSVITTELKKWTVADVIK